MRLVISNQRGGVGKTTTAITLARCFADRGRKVLLIDTDSQGSISAVLGLRPQYVLYDFLIPKLAFKECVTPAFPGLDVICSSRHTVEAEAALHGQTFREFVFEHLLEEPTRAYDIVLLDVAPSITLLQTCAMVFAQRVLIPVDMDVLSVQGATASINAAETANRMLGRGLNIQTIGILPIKVDRRLAMTDTVLNTLEDISSKRAIPLMPAIRTDQTVTKASRARKFLADFEPRSRALEDYNLVADKLLALMENATDARTVQAGQA
jgi:chromosome partitioning protein